MATIRITRNPVGQYMLYGISQKVGRPLETLGWKWVRGLGRDRGVWGTTSAELAQAGADRLGIEIIKYDTF